MPTAYITEFAALARDPSGMAGQIHDEPAITTQVLSYTVTTKCAPLNKLTHAVRIDIEDSANGFAHVEFSGPNNPSPVADANSQRIFHREPEARGVKGGSVIAFWDGASV